MYSIEKFLKLTGASLDTMQRWDKKGLLKSGTDSVGT
jgi:DNA-binding transcriptional MerR regulator